MTGDGPHRGALEVTLGSFALVVPQARAVMEVVGVQGVVGLQIEPGADVDAEELQRPPRGCLRSCWLWMWVRCSSSRRGLRQMEHRAVEALAVRAMLISAMRTAVTAVSVVGTVRLCLKGNKKNRVRLTLNGNELEVDGLSPEAQELMVSEWHARAASSVTS